MDGLITANRLSDGVVVFWDVRGGWSEDLSAAAILSDETAKAAGVEAGRLAEQRNEIVGAYWIELEKRGGQFVPKLLREAIRAVGPTVRRDLGKPAASLVAEG